MKHYRIYFIALVILISLMPVVALASGAFWQGEIRVTNNSTSTANNVTATVNISSQGLIDNGYATANLSDVAIEHSGTSVAFMPGIGSNPWVVFVDSIGAGLNVVYDLFTGGATGGKIRYFPGAGGMTTDNFSIGNNFTIEQKGWVDTSYSGLTVTGGNDVVNQTNHTVNLFSDIEAGKLLLVFFASDENPVITFPGGWTQLFQTADGANNGIFGAWYRVADGTEGATITVTTSTNQMTAHTSYLIDNYTGTPEDGTPATANDANPDPPSLNPAGWGTETTLWFAACGYNNNYTVSSYPADYSDGRNDYADDASGVGVGTAVRELVAASADPGTFTISSSSRWVANTVAVRGIKSQKTLDFKPSAFATAITATGNITSTILDSGTSVTAPNVSSGNHTRQVGTDGVLFGMGIDDDWDWGLPITNGLVFNAPMWHDESNADPFITKDLNEVSCNVDGATWSSTNGYSFDGATNLITATSEAAIQNLTDWTFMAWVYPETLGGGNFGRVFETVQSDWRVTMLGTSNFQCQRSYATTAASSVTTGNPVTLNAWNFITIYLSSADNKIHILVNNVEASYLKQQAGVGAIASDLTNWIIGNQIGGARGWDGYQGDFMLYNRVLTPTERTANFNATKWKYNGSSDYYYYQAVGSGVPNNANDWAFLQNYSMPYMEYTSVDINGSPAHRWEWEYDTVFHDSIGSVDATPTFRTASSDNISASLISFDPVTESKMPTFSLAATYEILTGTPTMPSGMFDGGSYSKLPSAPINEILDEASVPRAAWWYPFLFFGICVIGFIVYGATTMIRGPSGNLHEGQIDGSLLLMFIVMEVLLVVCAKMGLLPLWPSYLFPIAGIALILSKKHYAWG